VRGSAVSLVSRCALLALAPLSAATLKGPVAWGSPDQPWGVRRAVTAADRAALAAYRSGHKKPIFETNFESAAELAAN
jgi:hypothetical protein